MHANHSTNIPSGATDRTMIPKCEYVPNLINSSMQEDEIYEDPDRLVVLGHFNIWTASDSAPRMLTSSLINSPAGKKKKAPRIKGWGLRRFSTIGEETWVVIFTVYHQFCPNLVSIASYFAKPYLFPFFSYLSLSSEMMSIYQNLPTE